MGGLFDWVPQAAAIHQNCEKQQAGSRSWALPMTASVCNTQEVFAGLAILSVELSVAFLGFLASSYAIYQRANRQEPDAPRAFSCN